MLAIRVHLMHVNKNEEQRSRFELRYDWEGVVGLRNMLGSEMVCGMRVDDNVFGGEEC